MDKACSNCLHFEKNIAITSPCNECLKTSKMSSYLAIGTFANGFDRDTQPAPKPNGNPAIWACVIQDMAARDILGASRYGTRFQAGNGREMMKDAYEEALDLACYLRGAIFERDGK